MSKINGPNASRKMLSLEGQSRETLLLMTARALDHQDALLSSRNIAQIILQTPENALIAFQENRYSGKNDLT